MKTKHLPLVQDSGNQEYYTDIDIIALVREVLGGIDLDPASSEIANRTVNANRIYTREDNGLSLPWRGKVWLNHPFGKGELACSRYTSDGKNHRKGDFNCKKRICNDESYKYFRGHHINEDIPGNLDWIRYLEEQFNAGNVTEAINIAFADLSSEWGRTLTGGVHCIPDKRVNFWVMGEKGLVKNKGVTKGVIIRYWGSNPDKFYAVFSKIGRVCEPYSHEAN